MSETGNMIDQLFDEMENVEQPVYHEHKLFCVNEQMVIDCECQEHPIHCYARNVARKFYHPDFSHQDEQKDYGISRTDVVSINIDGTEKEVARVKNNLRSLCTKCRNRSK